MSKQKFSVRNLKLHLSTCACYMIANCSNVRIYTCTVTLYSSFFLYLFLSLPLSFTSSPFRPIWQFSGVSLLPGPGWLSEETGFPHLWTQQCGDHAEICAQRLLPQVQ